MHDQNYSRGLATGAHSRTATWGSSNKEMDTRGWWGPRMNGARKDPETPHMGTGNAAMGSSKDEATPKAEGEDGDQQGGL